MAFSQRPLLIADDDQNVVAYLRTLLSREHFLVDTALDGEDALRKIKRNWYSLILLDLLLPKMNGFEILRELKALHPRILNRIIVITGASTATLSSFDERQVFALLRKPFTRGELLPLVRQCAGIDPTEVEPRPATTKVERIPLHH